MTVFFCSRGYLRGGRGYLGGTPYHLKHTTSDLLGTPYHLKEGTPELFGPTFPEKGATLELLGTLDHLKGRMSELLGGTLSLFAPNLQLRGRQLIR
jgi:hypothetical protein